jgi:16S rRNA (guanine527-N7)-methyltransferase
MAACSASIAAVNRDFLRQVGAVGLELDLRQRRQLQSYRDLIARSARRYSLTAVRDPAEIERRHILESLAFGKLLVDLGAMPRSGDCRAIDLGTGAGLPGVPIKVAWPEMRLSLLEANAKRCAFLREVVDQLLLPDVIVLEGRAEVWARDAEHRGAYDLALARAVAPLPVLLEYSLPFLRRGGVLAAPKGGGAAREAGEAVNALRTLGGALQAMTDFLPPGGMAQTVVLVRKTRATPERFPRRPGIPGKRPL